MSASGRGQFTSEGPQPTPQGCLEFFVILNVSTKTNDQGCDKLRDEEAISSGIGVISGQDAFVQHEISYTLAILFDNNLSVRRLEQ